MMIDKTNVKSVEVVVDSRGKVWVNIDGECALRVQHAQVILIDDPYRGRDTIRDELNQYKEQR